jgi:predicted acyltransferase (DUF342 family)
MKTRRTKQTQPLASTQYLERFEPRVVTNTNNTAQDNAPLNGWVEFAASIRRSEQVGPNIRINGDHKIWVHSEVHGNVFAGGEVKIAGGSKVIGHVFMGCDPQTN